MGLQPTQVLANGITAHEPWRIWWDLSPGELLFAPASPFLTNLSEMYRCDFGARSHPGPLVTQGWTWHQWVRKPNKPVLTPEGFSLLGLPQGTQMWTRTHARPPHVGYPDKTVFSSYLKVIPNKESWTKSLWKFFFFPFWVLDGMGVGVCALPKEWLVTLQAV